METLRKGEISKEKDNERTKVKAREQESKDRCDVTVRQYVFAKWVICEVQIRLRMSAGQTHHMLR